MIGEEFVEIVDASKGEQRGDLGYRVICGSQQLLGGARSFFCNQFLYGGACALLDDPAQVVFVIAKRERYLLHRQCLMTVLGDIALRQLQKTSISLFGGSKASLCLL